MLFPQKINVVASAQHANPHNETVVVQNDTAVEFYVAVVGDNGQTELPEGATYTLVCLHLRKQPTEKLGTLQEDGNVMFKLTHMELSETGPIQAQVRVYHPVGGRLTSDPFIFHVAPDPTYGAEIKPEDQSIIEQVIGEGPAIIAEAKKETELNITERARLTGAVGGALSSLADDKAQALLEMSQSKATADESAQTALQAADNADQERERLTQEVSGKITEVETARSATEEATSEARSAAQLAIDEAEAARLQKEEVQEVLGAGPVASVNGKTGIVSGLATQESVDQVAGQLADKVGGERKAELEDLSPNVLGAIEGGEGTTFNLLSIPQNHSVAYETLDDEMRQVVDTFEVIPPKNLYDKAKAVIQQYVADSTGRISDTTSALAWTGKETVEPETDYTWSIGLKSFGSVSYWNGTVWLGRLGVANGMTVVPFTTPPNCTHVSINIRFVDPYTPEEFQATIDTIQLEKGSVATPYEPYSTVPKREFNAQTIKNKSVTVDKLGDDVVELFGSGTDTSSASRWKDKKWYVFGDSNSQNNAVTEYHKILAASKGITVANYAKGGAGYITKGSTGTVPNISEQIASGGANPDLITIFSGGNDYSVGQAMGTIADAPSLTTFYGALKLTFDAVIAKYPLSTIAVIIQMRRSKEGASTNGVGGTTQQYADATKEVCDLYGIPYLDMYYRGGIFAKNTEFLAEYMTDGVHLTNTGQQKVAHKIGSYLETL